MAEALIPHYFANSAMEQKDENQVSTPGKVRLGSHYQFTLLLRGLADYKLSDKE